MSRIRPGLLSLCGIVSAILGEEKPRDAGVYASCLVLGPFFVNLMLAANSFH